MTDLNAELIVFDLDGTLLDTLDDLAGAANHALRVFDLPERSIEEIRSFVGNGTRLLIQRAVPDTMSTEDAEAVFAEFTRYYDKHLNDNTRPYEGIMETLSVLHKEGYQLGMLSNKPHPAVLDLADLYFKGQFDYLAGEKPGIPRKPDPSSLLNMIADAGVSPERTIYIGDSEPDAMTVTGAGTHGIGVLWGFRSSEELAAAGMKHFVTEPSEIPGLCRELLGRTGADDEDKRRESAS